MAKRAKRTSKSQQITNLATLGLPAPARAVFGTRLGSFLFILLIPALVVSGILTVEWKDGRPRFKFDRERAREVREEIPQKIGDGSKLSLPQFAEKESVFGNGPAAPLLSLPEQVQIPKPEFSLTPSAEEMPRFHLPTFSPGGAQEAERPRALVRIREIARSDSVNNDACRGTTTPGQGLVKYLTPEKRGLKMDVHRTVLTLFCCMVGFTMPAVALGQSVEDGIVDSANAVLVETMTLQNERIPQKLLSDACGIAIVPNTVKGGFVVGVRRGHGVILREAKMVAGRPPLL